MGREGLGQFEQTVLLAVHHLQGRGYAVSIGDDLKNRAGRDASLGAIYATLDRLEKKGFVTSRLGDPTPERGGKPKRFYQITAPGVLELFRARDRINRVWADALPLGASS